MSQAFWPYRLITRSSVFHREIFILPKTELRKPTYISAGNWPSGDCSPETSPCTRTTFQAKRCQKTKTRTKLGELGYGFEISTNRQKLGSLLKGSRIASSNHFRIVCGDRAAAIAKVNRRLKCGRASILVSLSIPERRAYSAR